MTHRCGYLAGARAFKLLRCMVGLVGLLVVAHSHAQTFPARPVRLVVPFAAGGLTDVVIRLMAPEMEKGLGQPAIIENRPGGGSAAGISYVAKAPPDGYISGFISAGAMVIQPVIQKDFPYDPVKDLAPVGLVFQAPLIWSVKADSPWKSVRGLVAYAKANPGKLTFGTNGAGDLPHLLIELLKDEAGINIVPVHYKGEAPAFQDFLGGRIDVTTAGYGTLEQYLKSGSVRTIAQLGDTRSSLYPDLPTAKEQGFANVVGTGWLGMVAPAGTPKDALNKLSDSLGRAARSQAVRDKLATQYAVPVGSTPEAFAEFVQQQRARLTPILKRLDIKTD